MVFFVSLRQSFYDLGEKKIASLCGSIQKEIHKGVDLLATSSLTSLSSRISKKKSNEVVTFWIHLEKEKKRVHLQIYSSPKITAMGAFKKIKNSVSYDFFYSQEESFIRQYDSVLIRELRPEGMVEKNVMIQKKIMSKLEGRVKIVAQPLFERRSPKGKMEVEQVWYPANFIDAKNEFFLDREKKLKITLSFLDKLKIFRDLACSLELFHVELKLVHGDVRGRNFLLSWSEVEKRIEGLLNDFDFTDEPFFEKRDFENPQNHIYWDLAANFGLRTFFMDTYGLLLSMGRIFFYDDFIKFNEDRRKILKKDKFEKFLYREIEKYLSQELKKESFLPKDFPAMPKGSMVISYSQNLVSSLLEYQEPSFNPLLPFLNKLQKETKFLKELHMFIYDFVQKDKEIFLHFFQDVRVPKNPFPESKDRLLLGKSTFDFYENFPSMRALIDWIEKQILNFQME